MIKRIIRYASLSSLIVVIAACGHGNGAALAHTEAQSAVSTYVTLDPTLMQLRNDFNADAGDVRLVYIVGATCPECLRGMDDMGKTLAAQMKNPRLHTFVVYVPALGAKAKDIQATLPLVPGEQVSRYWDPSGTSGVRYRHTLGLKVYAWDVWMIYGNGQQWKQKFPPKPDFWMHQLNGVPASNFLNPGIFAEQVMRYLKQAEMGNASSQNMRGTGATAR